MTNQISPSDLNLFHKAQVIFTQSQGLLQFCKEHLSSTYNLGPNDTVDMVSGVITRVSAEPPTQYPEPIESI